ncbi:N-6 DNA methylase [Nonomuraea sp. PA05]|uniref:N-6 DNA methylase n=1 Tax=Nonomuraea sp. PA05 TaxID=2604466 RepID=UPI0016523035|nr:N-6 DNA methylase [Nonomuraea sp. PA05]
MKCIWSGGASDAIYQDGEPLIDIALLALKKPIPEHLAPIQLTTDIPEHTPYVAPGNPAAIHGVVRFAASGKVSWSRGRLVDGAPVIQLSCNESAAGLPLQGLSGAPVLVGSTLKAAGIVRWNHPREDHPTLAAGAAMYATPITAVIDRWPHLAVTDQPRGESLAEIVKRLAARTATRTSGQVAANIRQLLLSADLGLQENDLNCQEGLDVDGQRSWIDVHPGFTVLEIKRDLRRPGSRQVAEQQLHRNLMLRRQQTENYYIGILTDGIEWLVYHHVDNVLQQQELATFNLEQASLETTALISWLEALLATQQRIKPTPKEIIAKLGSTSPSYKIDSAELAAIYRHCRDHPRVQVKRDLWAKLLTTASGTNFIDDDALFVDHTLLVLIAELVGHAVIGFDPQDPEVGAEKLMSGGLFSEVLVGGVIEPDFFDWLAHAPDGEMFIKNMARRLTRFAWDQVEHDVMKVLYESIIPKHVRHRLGEYYTPDWLAEEVLAHSVSDPLEQRVLDASCGSGTFLFHAVRRYVSAAEAEGKSLPEIVSGVGQHVIGFDVHPVAVTLARVTYLLAIGMHRLNASGRPAFTVPVYLGDSLRWGEELSFLSAENFSVPTDLDHQSFVQDPSWGDNSESLLFPQDIVADAGQFDRLVAELARRATARSPETAPPSLANAFAALGIDDDSHRALLQRTFERMCELHDANLDHIWGYYVRNIARPVWLARPENQVDVLVGNPPWLAYRHMTQNQQGAFRAMCVQRGLWSGASATPSQELAALFVLRCIELYLRPDGNFGFVMPLATLSRSQYTGFRAAHYRGKNLELKVAFDRPWDLHQIKPSFFQQSVGVIFGKRMTTGEKANALVQSPEVWSGRFETKSASRAEAAEHVSRSVEGIRIVDEHVSPYARRFTQGATIVPRFLFMVEDDAIGPLGVGGPRRKLRSRRSALEKKPWKELSPLQGTVEERFIKPVYLGDSILPFRCLETLNAVIPWDGERLLHCEDDRLTQYEGLESWWRAAEKAWIDNRSSARLTLVQRLDYRRGLSQQFPAAPHRVAYGASGVYLAAAIISNTDAIIEHKLYWAAAHSLDEARFLTAILNSNTLTMAVRPYQARGEHNPRDFDKYVFRIPIPSYDPENDLHQGIVRLAVKAETVAQGTALPSGRFEALRKRIRDALMDDGVGGEIDAAVQTLLSP